MEAEPFLTAMQGSTLLIGAAVCFVAGVIGGLSGFGTGMLVAIVITPLVGPKALIPLMAVVMIVNNASRVWFFRRGLQWRAAAVMLATAIPGALLGVQIYQQMNASALQILIGLVIAVSIPLKYWLRAQPTPSGWLTLNLFGFVYGALSSVVLGAGLLVLPALMGFGLAGPALIATDALITVGVNIAKAIFFQQLDALTWSIGVFGVCAGLATVPGVALASRLSERLGVRIQTRLVEVLVVIGGLHMSYSGWLSHLKAT